MGTVGTVGTAVTDARSIANALQAAIAHAAVAEAVGSVLARISRDYGIPLADLQSRYGCSAGAAAAGHVPFPPSTAAAAAEGAAGRCAFIMATSNRCKRQSRNGAYCCTHAAAGLAQDAKRKRVEAYGEELQARASRNPSLRDVLVRHMESTVRRGAAGEATAYVSALCGVDPFGG